MDEYGNNTNVDFENEQKNPHATGAGNFHVQHHVASTPEDNTEGSEDQSATTSQEESHDTLFQPPEPQDIAPEQPNLDQSRYSYVTSSSNNQNTSRASELVKSIKQAYSSHIVGQDEMFESIIVSLLSGGHLLIEGVPGLAKTTAAHSIASAIGADFVRIQCTPDMLPSDIIGTQIYNQQTHEFTTQLGPVNHQFVLVDEINRTSAKTQSALLEAMQERQVSIGGESFTLPKGFIVLATQNPIEHEGTYPLPEAQLDRFLLKHVIDYPNIDDEIAVLKLSNTPQAIEAISAVASIDEIIELQDAATSISVDDKILQYIATIVAATRQPEKYGLNEIKQFLEIGASPRASLALLAAARSSALISQSNFVTPDHVKPFIIRALRHRMVLTYEAEAENVKVEDIINKIGSVIQVP